LKAFRPAFTIIEILVSVIIISFAILFVLKIHSENHEQIVYITQRNTLAFQDSLYLDKESLRYHKDHKTAYDVLEKTFKITEQESREILKQHSSDIFTPEEIEILPPAGQPGPSTIVNEVMLKGKQSSIYSHFRLEPF
jgi:competence protein ComGC